jgi:mRNA interferase RelE/StbE
VRDRRLRLSFEVQAAIRAMHPHLKRRVRAALDRVRTNPESGKPLMRELSGWWSMRVGRLRIIYRPRGHHRIVDVAAIGPRTSIYLEVSRLVRLERGR